MCAYTMETPVLADWGIFQDELRSFVFKRVKDKAAADDIVQDVFLKVYNNLGQLKNSEKLTGWIYQITRNTITDHFRKKNKTFDFIDDDSSSDSTNLNACVANCLRNLIPTLPGKYREALELSEFGNLSQIQLAKRLGISYSGAKSRVQRARLILRQKIEKVLHVKIDVYGNVMACENRGPCCC
jgi:RNA polymerase sigma-70 factor (ECF subfamily)